MSRIWRSYGSDKALLEPGDKIRVLWPDAIAGDMAEKTLVVESVQATPKGKLSSCCAITPSGGAITIKASQIRSWLAPHARATAGPGKEARVL